MFITYTCTRCENPTRYEVHLNSPDKDTYCPSVACRK
jgi:hypothetical protein